MRTRHLNKYFSGFALWLLVAAATILMGAQAKSQAKPVVRPGVVSGRVFLITVGGDIKPARMANVYLLYLYRSVKFAEAHKEDQNSAGMEWGVELNKAMEENIKATQERQAAHDFSNSESLNCLRSLAEYSSALSKTSDWVSANKKEWQLIVGQADEEGNFRIAVPRPGDYRLVVDGHAGFNNAVWETHPVTVRPGIETTVKMASPEKACLETSQ